MFLFAFLPLFLAAYFAVRKRAARNGILLAASLLFYAWGEPVYIALMVVSIACNWGFGLHVGEGRPHPKRWLAISLAVNLAILGFFKYQGFLADNVNALVGSTVVPNLQLPLPIGISFYTLQAITYVVDVYRGRAQAQRNPFLLGVYIAMFPQLIAGPIVRYETIWRQISHRRETMRSFTAGARLFTIGLAKKVLLANTMGLLAADMLEAGPSAIGALGAWGGLVAFTFQIYFDFSGYSDMAIGLGKMCGFQYLRNFNYPYISKSITEFWRRWHISLGTFFRDYVYIPLGGSRCRRSRWALNLLVVWFLTGLWHGAAWNFVLWGFYNLAFLLAEKFIWGRVLGRAPAPVQHAYAIVAFTLGWLLFWQESPSGIAQWLAAMAGCHGVHGYMTAWEVGVWQYLPVFAACIVASTPIAAYVRALVVAWASAAPGERPAWPSVRSFMESDLPNAKYSSTAELCDLEAHAQRAAEESAGARESQPHAERAAKGVAHPHVLQVATALQDVALLALLIVSIMNVIMGAFNPFIYFRF